MSIATKLQRHKITSGYFVLTPSNVASRNREIQNALDYIRTLDEIKLMVKGSLSPAELEEVQSEFLNYKVFQEDLGHFMLIPTVLRSTKSIEIKVNRVRNSLFSEALVIIGKEFAHPKCGKLLHPTR
jgi:hypothetical protein